MKKYFLFLALSVMMVAFVSCNGKTENAEETVIDSVESVEITPDTLCTDSLSIDTVCLD